MTVSKEVSRLRRYTRRYKRYDERYFDIYSWPFYEKYRNDVFHSYTDLVVLDGDLDLEINKNRILSDLNV